MDIRTLMDEEDNCNNKEAMLMKQLGGLMVFDDNDNTNTNTNTSTNTNINTNNMMLLTDDAHIHSNSPSSTPDVAASSWHLNLFHPTTTSSSSSSSSSSSLQLLDNTHPTLAAVGGDIHVVEHNTNGRDVINYDRDSIHPSSSSVHLLFEPIISSSVTMPLSPTRSCSDVINEVRHHNDAIHVNDDHSHDGVISSTSKPHMHVSRDHHVIGAASGDHRIEHIDDASNEEFSLQMFTLGTNNNNDKNNGDLKKIMGYDNNDDEFYDGHDVSAQGPHIYMPVMSNAQYGHGRGHKKKGGGGIPFASAAAASMSMSMTTTASKRKRGSRGSCKNVEERENQRMTHIVVERNRRRQMNEHLRILRALMPPSYVQRVCYACIHPSIHAL